MAYTLPNGTSANFSVPARNYTEPGATTHTFQFPNATYTAALPIKAVVNTYGYPTGTYAHFTVPVQPVGATGTGSVVVDVYAAGVGKHYTPVIGSGAAVVAVSAEGHGEYTTVNIVGSGAVEVAFDAEGAGRHGVKGSGSASVTLTASGSGKHGVKGVGEAAIGVSAGGIATHIRYELRGEVRIENVLVNRRVRAYSRDTGELVGEADTIAGKFQIHTGLQSAEHYIIPIQLTEDATDWAPPCANRVTSVLAYD